MLGLVTQGASKVQKLPQRRQMLLCHHWSTVHPSPASSRSILAHLPACSPPCPHHTPSSTHTPNPSPGDLTALSLLCVFAQMPTRQVEERRSSSGQLLFKNSCISSTIVSCTAWRWREKQAGCVCELSFLCSSRRPGVRRCLSQL